MKKLFLLLLLSFTFANSSVVVLTDKEFESTIKEKRSIVMFSATWCGACKQMKPQYLKASKIFEGKVKFISVDTDEQKKLATQYGIESIPTTIYNVPSKNNQIKKNFYSKNAKITRRK